MAKHDTYITNIGLGSIREVAPITGRRRQVNDHQAVPTGPIPQRHEPDARPPAGTHA